ncbi:MAG: hypothetical protein C0434_07840 [Xanthomonadaceae bacterium]|nr:hypothetical protein [Xanthomonadaceae bacterium]
MATITRRKNAAGEWRYTAQIRIRRDGKLVHSEAKTFGREAEAKAWKRMREGQLAQPGALDKGSETVGDLIRRYVDEFAPVMRWRRSKTADLKRLLTHDIAGKVARHLTSQDLIAHVQARIASGTGPATAGNDLVWLGGVLRTARSVWGMPIAAHVAEDARDACRRLRLVAPSKRRDRRPTQDEIDRLLAHYRAAKRVEIPMADIIEFAIASARRESEICRLEWRDLDRASSAILVRDVKHPTDREGNHQQAKLTAAALAVIDRQPKGELIFPYNSKSVGTSFMLACRMLGIVDLHFHDLRHEATSRLFEAGYSIPEVAQFTLHRSWKDLQRYANLRPAKLVLR